MLRFCTVHHHAYVKVCSFCIIDQSKAAVEKARAERPKAKSDVVKQEKESLLLMGDANASEHLRRVHAGVHGGHSDSPTYNAEVQRLRYAGGGLHDRLREAAKRQHDYATYPLINHAMDRQQYKCFVGIRMHARGYKYEA